MKTITKTVSGNQVLEGIAKREKSVDVQFSVCENMQDVQSVLPGKNAEEKTASLLKLVNDARWAELRSATYAKITGTGKKTIIGSVKKLLKQFETVFPAMSVQERAVLVMGLPGMKEKLEAEGLTIDEAVAAPEAEGDETQAA